MMYGWHGGGGGWLGSILVLVLVGVIVYFIAREVTLRRMGDRPGTTPSPGSHVAPPLRVEPLDILRERFARGEITVEEFETAKRALGYASGPVPPPAGPGAPPTV